MIVKVHVFFLTMNVHIQTVALRMSFFRKMPEKFRVYTDKSKANCKCFDADLEFGYLQLSSLWVQLVGLLLQLLNLLLFVV